MLADSKAAGPIASLANSASSSNSVEADTFYRNVVADTVPNVLVGGAGDDNGGADGCGSNDLEAGDTGETVAVDVPSGAEDRNVDAGAVDDDLTSTTNDGVFLADSVGDGGVVVDAGEAPTGEGCVGSAGGVDGETLSEVEVESVGAGVVVDALSA